MWASQDRRSRSMEKLWNRIDLDGVVERIHVSYLAVHGAHDRQIPVQYAHRSRERAVASPKRQPKIFTERKPGRPAGRAGAGGEPAEGDGVPLGHLVHGRALTLMDASPGLHSALTWFDLDPFALGAEVPSSVDAGARGQLRLCPLPRARPPVATEVYGR